MLPHDTDTKQGGLPRQLQTQSADDCFYYDADSCAAAALALGLQLGSHTFEFEGTWAGYPNGCYYFDPYGNSRYAGQAYWGLGGTVEEMRADATCCQGAIRLSCKTIITTRPTAAPATTRPTLSPSIMNPTDPLSLILTELPTMEPTGVVKPNFSEQSSNSNSLVGGIVGAGVAVISLIVVVGIGYRCLIKNKQESTMNYPSVTALSHSQKDRGAGSSSAATTTQTTSASAAMARTSRATPQFIAGRSTTSGVASAGTVRKNDPYRCTAAQAQIMDIPSHIDYKDQGRDYQSVLRPAPAQAQIIMDVPSHIDYKDQGRDYQSVLRPAPAQAGIMDIPSQIDYKDQGRDYQSVLRYTPAQAEILDIPSNVEYKDQGRDYQRVLRRQQP